MVVMLVIGCVHHCIWETKVFGGFEDPGSFDTHPANSSAYVSVNIGRKYRCPRRVTLPDQL